MSGIKVVYTLDKEDIEHRRAILSSIGSTSSDVLETLASRSSNKQQQQQATSEISIKFQPIRPPERIFLGDDDEEEEQIQMAPTPVPSQPVSVQVAAIAIEEDALKQPEEPDKPKQQQQQQQQQYSRPKQSLRSLAPKQGSSSLRKRQDVDFPESIDLSAVPDMSAPIPAPVVPFRRVPARMGLNRRSSAAAAASTAALLTSSTHIRSSNTSSNAVPLSEALHQRIKDKRLREQMSNASLDEFSDLLVGGGEREALQAAPTLLGTPTRSSVMRHALSSSTRHGKTARHGNGISQMEQSFRLSKSKTVSLLANLAKYNRTDVCRQVDHLELHVLDLVSRDEAFALFSCRLVSGGGNQEDGVGIQCIVPFHPFEDASNAEVLREMGHISPQQVLAAQSELGNAMQLAVFKPYKFIKNAGEEDMLVCSGLVKVL